MKSISIKSILLSALVLVSSGAAAQNGSSYNGHRNDLARMQESGPMVVGGGGATTGPNYRNLSMSPLPGSREEMDEIMRRPNVADLPVQEIRPIPGPPMPRRTSR